LPTLLKKKTPIQLGTLITVAKCGQLSHLLSEDSSLFPHISLQVYHLHEAQNVRSKTKCQW